MRTPLRSLSLLLAVLSLAACPKHPAPSTRGPLDDASRRVLEGKASAHDEALAGFAAYLLKGDLTTASAHFEKALASDKGEVWAHHGRSELARRTLDTRRRVLEGLAPCASHPEHPLCAVGARLALELMGESPRLDQEIEELAAAGLKAGAGGDAAYHLRLAISGARRSRGDFDGARAVLADAGAVSQAALLGPYSAFHHLDRDRVFSPEKGEIPASEPGPAMVITPRKVIAYDGRYTVSTEATAADVYYLASDVTVAEGGRYQARASSAQGMKLFVDGALAGERRVIEGYEARELAAEVTLAPGRHRLLAKFSRGAERSEIILAVARVDGRPAALVFAPASGTFNAPAPTFSEPANAWPDARSLVAALEEEVGGLLASFVAARDAMERDDQAAKVLAGLAVDDVTGPKNPAQKTATPAPSPLLVLRAEALLGDRATPTRIARGRAQRDLEDALRQDPAEASALQRLSVHARSDNRLDESAELLDRARKAVPPGTWRVLLSEARLAQARGLDALADDAARRALTAEPGLCDAVVLRYDLARRLDAVALADSLVKDAALCPGNLHRQAEHARLRGDVKAARALFEKLALEHPLDPSAKQSVAQMALGQGLPLEAAALYAELQQQWPRNALFHKRRADALEKSGELKGARAERETALSLDGSDLRLRRALAVEDGREILDDLKQDGAKVLAEYRSRPHTETAAGVYILDASAMESYPDGSTTERTHTVAKVVDQRGVSRLAEVHIPSGAEILSMRTLKADGRVLEPENVGEKEGISLPGVEVGDFVEYEYLAAQGPRGPALPGFAFPKFYFRISDAQIFRSVFDVRSPKGTGLAVDAHNLPAPRITTDGLWERLSLQQEEIAPFIPEPGQPPPDEILPFVQAGAGVGTEPLLTSFADLLADHARRTPEVIAFAREAAAGKAGEDAVRALYEKVMQEVKGKEGSLGINAAATLAQGRGSRLLLLRASLAAIGVKSHLVLVQPFNADPAPYRFPNADQFGSPALLVALEGREIYLDPSVRFAPFGRLGAQAEGQPAVVLPEPGEALRSTTTPRSAQDDGKHVVLKLALAADGTLSGEGEERYDGFDGAYLKSGLERLDKDQRRQAIEASVSRTFRNAALKTFSVEEDEKSGTPAALHYTFNAPGFAFARGAELVVTSGIFPSGLGRRYVSLSERKTPLFIGGAERSSLHAELALPPGLTLASAEPGLKLATPFGRFERTVVKTPARVTIDEELEVKMARVPPAQYPDFVAFVTAVDKAQVREWVFAK